MSGHFDRVMMQWYPDDDKYYCEVCEEECDEDSLVEIDGHMVCESCSYDAIECEECGELHFENNINYINDKVVCNSCEETLYPICIVSGKQFYDPDEENDVAPEYRHKHLTILVLRTIRRLKYKWFKLTHRLRYYGK